MLVPSLACQASCKYCFGPHKGAVMDERTAREAVFFIHSVAEETDAKEISIIFHGGEPLLAPVPVWDTIFDAIRSKLADYKLSLSLQSNLWNLDDEFLRMFRENNVAIGTSLDGPEEICDINRGDGYYEKTIASIKRANDAGCLVSAIATITKQTLPHALDVVKFFRNNGMSLVLHDAVAAMDVPVSPFILSAGEYAKMIKDVFPWYVKNCKYIKIDTLDHFARAVVTGNPGVCTFRDCFGMFLSIAPDGAIASCQRLAGREGFALGNIFSRPSLQELYESGPAKRQRGREKQAHERCAGCEWLPVCKGGCYYNAIVSGDGIIDSHCEAYKEVFAFVHEKVMEEMQSEENIEAVASRPAGPGEHPLLRRGAYTSLSGQNHPSKIAENARRILAIYELCKTNDPHTAAGNLYDQKICGNPEATGQLLERIKRGAYQSRNGRNNCYIHVTFDCNLRCKHCYANAGDSKEEMRPADFEKLVCEAVDAGFRQIVITGGEPLVHSRRYELLDICNRNKGRGTNLVLRTNLAGDFSETDFGILAGSLDQVVVSVDGNEETHNARRGAGTYGNVVYNLEQYAKSAASVSGAAELSLACVMNEEGINSEPGNSVRQLAARLNINRVRFRPLLPLGRAADMDEPVICEGLMQHMLPEDMLKTEFRPLLTCGIGQNIFIRPDGGAYPCYAWCGEHTFIGNVFADGLDGLGRVLETPGYLRLADCTVDTIGKCKGCEFRYLCGGACRAWGNQSALDLNAMPVECGHLREKALSLVEAARRFILE